jgi:hypothetical protein
MPEAIYLDRDQLRQIARFDINFRARKAPA